MERFDAAVIGSGPGGYVSAIRLGQLGKNTVLIEKGALGGVCLNWGCIPSKAVIHASHLREEMNHGNAIGIGTGAEVPVDVDKLRAWKEGIVTKLQGGVGGLLKAAGVTVIKGTATLTGANSFKVDLAEGGTQEIEAESIVLGTGGPRRRSWPSTRSPSAWPSWAAA